MLLMNLKSISRWLCCSEFEMFINLIGILISSIMLCLKLDNFFDSITWKQVFMPLFIADVFQAYFCIIVFLRQLSEYQSKQAIWRLILSGVFLTSRILFKLFIYFILSGSNLKYQFASFPLIFHLTILLFRSCRYSTSCKNTL